MNCGNNERHNAHTWGKWHQHFCKGKRNPEFQLTPRPPL